MTPENENPASRESLRVYNPAPIQRREHGEGSITRVIEQQTAKVPSPVFLVAAMASMMASLGFEITGRRKLSRFVGMWAPTLLMMGIYNKFVKMLGPR